MRSFIGLLTLMLGLFSSVSYAEQSVRVGYLPNLWFPQPAIISGEEWDKESGFKLELKRFPGPSALIQAFAAGDIDIMYNNIGTTLSIVERGIEIRVIATCYDSDVSLLGRGRLIELEKTVGAANALALFVKETGRKIKIGTNPRGSTSDLMVNYWLERAVPGHRDLVEVVNAADQAQFQQAFFSRSVDLAATFAPIDTIARRTDPTVDIFVSAEEIMRPQPGGVVVVRKDFLAENRPLLSKYLGLHERASHALRDGNPAAAEWVRVTTLQGLLPADVIAVALQHSKQRYPLDPGFQITPTRIIAPFMVAHGYLDSLPDIDSLFDTTVRGEK